MCEIICQSTNIGRVVRKLNIVYSLRITARSAFYGVSCTLCCLRHARTRVCRHKIPTTHEHQPANEKAAHMISGYKGETPVNDECRTNAIDQFVVCRWNRKTKFKVSSEYFYKVMSEPAAVESQSPEPAAASSSSSSSAADPSRCSSEDTLWDDASPNPSTFGENGSGSAEASKPTLPLRSYSKWCPAQQGATLVWRDVCVYANHDQKMNGSHQLKRIIDNSTGAIQPGTLMALMGSRFV